MTTEPKEIKELDLIKVKVIKGKHVDQLIEDYSSDSTQQSWVGVEFLAYISARDAMLARVLANGHLRVVRVITYIASMQNGQAGHEWVVAASNARAFAQSLPQLLLD